MKIVCMFCQAVRIVSIHSDQLDETFPSTLILALNGCNFESTSGGKQKVQALKKSWQYKVGVGKEVDLAKVEFSTEKVCYDGATPSSSLEKSLDPGSF